MYYKKILICSDFLMTKESEQKNNVKWVFDLVNEVIKTAVNASVETFVGYDDNTGDDRTLSRKIFFEKSRIKLFKEDVQFYYKDNEVTEDSLNYLKGYFSEDTIIIGYELSEQTKKVLSLCGIPYIDIWLHPVRYMDDILFAFKSNNEKINDLLCEENLNDSYYKLYASRLKVQSYKGFKRSQFHLKEKSALFVGQTLNDKAVLLNNKMLTILDFKSEFEDLTRNHNVVYYSRHPFVRAGDEDVLDFVTSFSNVELIDKPAYELITRDEIVSVWTISSSVATEAKFFGKNINYLFKPPVNVISSPGESDDEKYYSIYNKFCSVRFWNKILSPVFESKNDMDINFFDGKDKLRDALSFYWGYRHIDKTESLKMTVGNLFNNRKTLGSDSYSDAIDDFIRYSSSSNVEAISFDIFDTLVCRKTSSPRDIFRILEKNLFKEIGFSIQGFASLRIESEDKLRLEVLEQTGRQDITHSEIYERFQELSDLPSDIIEKLKNLEFEYELRFIRPRNSGLELFEKSLRTGKKVILTSDMYLEREQIEEILSVNGISGYNKLYLSSELGIRKHEGDLFYHVLKDLGIKGHSMLHIGDNINGDINSAREFNIKVIHTPRAIDNLKRVNKRCYNVLVNNYKTTNYQQNIINGVYANRFYDDIRLSEYGQSHFNGSGYELGYIALGPMIASFCTQIKNVAIKQGIKDIAFLSRDGLVFKRAFDKLFPNENISTKYVSSSRRSTQIASILSKVDILNILRKPVYSCKISDYLCNRFGLDFEEIKIESLIRCGLNTKSSMIGGKFDKELLKSIVLDHEKEILNNAHKEREGYINYIKSFNMEPNFAIVDIGYSGSIQKFFNEFVSSDVYGFYFSTFSSALNNIASDKSYSYISSLHNEKIKIHGINTHRFMYENIICSSEDSFLKIVNGEKFFSDENDIKRKKLVDKIHSGVEDFCSDISDLIDLNDNGIYIDPFNGEYLLKDFMKYPNPKDVNMFSSIKFQDGFASSQVRYLVPPDNELNNVSIFNNSIWKEGSNVVRKVNKSPVKKNVEPKKITNASHNVDNKKTSSKSYIRSMVKKDKIFNAMNYAINDRKVFKRKMMKFISQVK